MARTCKKVGKGRKVKSSSIQAIRQGMRKSIVWDAVEAKRNHLVQDFADGKKFYDVNSEQISMYFITNPPEPATGQQTKK